MFDAVTFAENAGYTERHASAFLNRTKHYFKWQECEEMLDIGCADGKITRNVLYPFVEKRLGHLYGGDCDLDAITIAKKLYATEKLSFAQMDVEDDQDASTNKNKFDHIFAFYLLHWVSSNKWPNNLFKMIKEGGQLFASVWLGPNEFTKTMQSLEGQKERPWWRYIEDYQSKFQFLGSSPVETITCHLINAGFVVDMVNIIHVQGEFDTKDALLKTMKSCHPLEERMPEEMYTEYWNDFFEELMRHVETFGESYLLKYQTLVFIASKP